MLMYLLSWWVQVALLQGLTDAAADQAAAASPNSIPNNATSKAQQWIRQQADCLAAQTSLPVVQDPPEAELIFLPENMTRAVHQSVPATDAAAATAAAGAADAPAGRALIQAGQQEAPGMTGQSVLQACTAERDQHTSVALPDPVSWLEWEQQLQVTLFVCVVSLASAKHACTCTCTHFAANRVHHNQLCARFCLLAHTFGLVINNFCGMPLHLLCLVLSLSAIAKREVPLSMANALQSDQSSTRCPDLADEFIHPHTEWMLKQPLAKYVLDPQPVYMSYTKPTASGGIAAASGSPSGPSNDASSPALEADTATQRDPSPEAAQTPRLTHTAPMAMADHAQSHGLSSAVPDQHHRTEQGQAANEQATPALSGFSASQPTDIPAGSTPAGELCLFCIVCGCPHISTCCIVLCLLIIRWPCVTNMV